MSQPGPSSKNPKEHEDTVDKYVNKCVRILISKMGSNIPFTLRDISTKLFANIDKGDHMRISTCINKAGEILEKNYGLKLCVIDTNSATNKYCLTNMLPVFVEKTDEENARISLLLIILTHIFMSNNNVPEEALWDFLENYFRLDINDNTEIDNIGNIKNFVNQTLMKQLYLKMELKEGESINGIKKYAWGPRAEETISKMDILKFVSKQFDDCDIKTWSHQHKEALIQFSENDN